MQRLGDLTDVPLEDITALALAPHFLTLPKIGPEFAPALHEREAHLLANLIVIRDGFLRLTGKRDPNACHVNHHNERTNGKPSARL